MRLIIFSVLDDWDIGELLQRSGHQIAAWIRPSWTVERKSSRWSRGVRRGLRVLLAQNQPICSVAPKYDLREWLTSNNIPMIACEDANAPAFRERLRQIGADLFVVAMYPQIFNRLLIDIPPHGVINYHPSLLPAYAGAQPGFWVLRNAEKETGITVHRMAEKIDSGDILVQEVIPIERSENLGHLMQRLHHRAEALIVGAIDAIAKDTIRPRPQDAKGRSYFRKKRADDLEIDWQESSEALMNLLRAVQPFEPLTARVRGRVVRIFDATVRYSDDAGETGEIVEKLKDRIVVQTGKGQFELTSFEVAPFHGWLNGLAKRFLLAKGDRFDPLARSPDTNDGSGQSQAATR